MNPEEQGILLSAYLDGELEGEQHAQVEAMLQNDAELAQQLEDMKGMGLALKSALEAEAGSMDFQSMEASVLEKVEDRAPARERTITEAPQVRMGFWDTLRAFVERPAVSFALGLLVAGTWTMWNPAVQSQGENIKPKQDSTLMAEGVSTTPLRAPESEQSFTKASPSLVLEALSVAKGKVVLDQAENDPDAPVVLWHFSESSDEDSASGPKDVPGGKASEPVENGDPL